MLTTLKDVFRPTWAKLIFSVMVGPCLTVGALLVGGMARHGPIFVQYAVLPFVMPYAFIVWLGYEGHFSWIALLVSAFLYWYVIFSVCASLVAHLFSRFRS